MEFRNLKMEWKWLLQLGCFKVFPISLIIHPWPYWHPEAIEITKLSLLTWILRIHFWTKLNMSFENGEEWLCSRLVFKVEVIIGRCLGDDIRHVWCWKCSSLRFGWRDWDLDKGKAYLWFCKVSMTKTGFLAKRPMWSALKWCVSDKFFEVYGHLKHRSWTVMWIGRFWKFGPFKGEDQGPRYCDKHGQLG